METLTTLTWLDRWSFELLLNLAPFFRSEWTIGGPLLEADRPWKVGVPTHRS
jgi:hypothetical protein